MELTEERLTVSRERSELDERVLEFTDALRDAGVRYAIVSGYVAILTGRSRGTEDVDVVLEPLSEAETESLVDLLEDRGFWGTAMPLADAYAMLSGGDRIRVARDGELVPNFEVWYAKRDAERAVLSDPIVADFGDETVQISPIELQIAYKLRLAERAGSTSGKDFEDALHLFVTFEEELNTPELEGYVEKWGVTEYYDDLRAV
jgi:hypothetical protein